MATDPAVARTLYSAAQCRELDRRAIEEENIPGQVLMKRAGRFAYESLRERWPDCKRIQVFCGAGNNAGDGYVVAALARADDLDVCLYYLRDPQELKGDAARAYAFARDEGVSMAPFDGGAALDEGVVVDALLGTGSRGAPRGDYPRAIEAINSSGLPVLAVDLPSGLEADTGHAPGACIAAHRTTTFIGRKQGLFTGRGPALCGQLRFSALGVPDAVYSQASPVRLADPNLLARELPPRRADAHKGHFGHVLIVGGETGLGGALIMAAHAAGRVGAGLVSAATRAEHCAPLLARQPEVMVHPIHSARELEPLFSRATALVLGPGLGRSPWSREIYQAVLAQAMPAILDADGLNLLAESAPPKAAAKLILTPHPGEAARLLGIGTAEVQADRFAAAGELAVRYGATVVLKGAGSLIADGDSVAVATAGNPGMASGGMGDVLSGIVGALLAQGLTPDKAAEAATVLHGEAGDRAAAAEGERGLLATDLLPHLRALVNAAPGEVWQR